MKEHGSSVVRIDSPVLLARSWVHRRFNTSDGCMGFGLLLFLSLPSLYLFISIPPLWRDSDGFYQVATKFDFLTVLHWPTHYCFCPRIPFLAATILDDVCTAMHQALGDQGYQGQPRM